MMNYINLNNIFNKIFVVFAISVLPFLTNAQSGDVLPEQLSGEQLSGEQFSGNQNILCPNYKYSVNGPSDVISNNLVDYSVAKEEDINSSNIAKIDYKLYKGEELLGVYTGKTFNHLFVNPNSFVLKVDVEDDDGCVYFIQKDINVYRSMILYIGKNVEGMDSFDQAFSKKSMLFKKINVSFSDADFVQKISENSYYLKNSKEIVLNYKSLNELFEALGKMKDLYNIDYNSKTIYLVSDEATNFLKRSLFKYLKLLDFKEINLVKSYNLLNLVNQFSIEKEDKSFVESLKTSDLDNGIMWFSKLVDYLIYNGFPSSLLYLILAGCLLSLLISIFRQIIGIPVFSLYSPLLFGMSLYILGIKFSMLLFVIAFLATSIVRLFTKKFYLLYSAKVSMIVILYLLFAIVYLWADKYFGFNFVDINVFLNNYIIFPIIYVSIASSKVYREGSSFLSKGFWILFFEFMLISFASYFLLSWNIVEFWLLSYPEILLLVLFLQILVGRFTGLQLLEYIRFRPLIGDEEE